MNFIFESLEKKFCRCISNVKKLDAHFFDDVFIEDDTLKKSIIQWFYELKYLKNISIHNFSYLFSNYEGIVFPVHVYGQPYDWHIEDNMGKHYRLSYSKMIYGCSTEYCIKTTETDFYTKYVYELTTCCGIMLKQWHIVQTPSGTSISFKYNSDKTTVILEDIDSIVEMVYPTLDHLYDSQISMYLFCLSNEFQYFDDVSFILEYMSDILEKSKKIFSLEITSYEKPFYSTIGMDKILLSKVYLLGSVVRTHFFTTRISDSIRLLHQQFPLERLEEFMPKHHI